MEAAASGAGVRSPGEAGWPPEMRLPGAPPPPPAEPPPAGMDDSQFLGSIMGEPAAARQGELAEAPVQEGAMVGLGAKKRGRPPKKRDGAAAVVPAAAKPARARREEEEEVVCFICFDGGDLVVCDRRGCPKVYHPACIKRDEAFFQSRSKWNCGWHICSSCEKAVHYMCYTCTYSVCKVCIKQGKFFSVRGTKGFCDTCFGTILLIESKDENSAKVDFDDINSWEYLFKLYWVDLKGKLSLTLEELTSAKSRWNIPSIPARKEKEESSDDLYDVNNDDDAGSDCSSRKRRRVNSSRKKGRKRQKANSDFNIAAKNIEPTVKEVDSLPTEVPNEGVSLPVVTAWASPELLEFVGHMRDGDRSFISQFDVQTLLLEYIKKNNLRDPQRKSQIVCDTRLHRLFRKARVAHFEMLKLLEMHFLVNETSRVNDNSQVDINLNAAQIDTNCYSDVSAKLSPDKRRRIHRKMEREPQVNHEAYAAVDMHNISLIYVRRSLMEDLIDDATFSDKIHGAFVRIKISGVGQKQDIYRLVKVVGTQKVPENYSIGKKKTNYALEILNLDKKEIITMDTISNHDFTEEECKRLRQSMKCGLISRLKVGDVQEKAKILQSVRVNDWLENEKQKLEHLRDRASETGRRKELRECVEKLQLLDNSEERSRRINEVLEVHIDSHMDPDYVSAEETDDKKAVGRSGWTRSDTSISQRKSKYPNIMHNHMHKNSDASLHSKRLMGSTIHGSGARRNFENFHSTNATDIPKSSITYEAGSVSSSVVTMSSDTEPEKVWHYKDPSGNVQGPFTLLQLSKWISHFPRDLRVWLTFESEERSLLLTEVLSKQQKDFSQAASVTESSRATLAGSGHNINSPSMDQSNALSPVGCSMLNSSVITVQSNKFPERESANSPDDSLSLSATSVPRKDAHTSNSQVQCQTKHSVSERSPGNIYEQTDLHHDGVQGGCSGESNHHHSSGALWSPTMAQMSCSGQVNVESHHNQHASWSQSQHDSKSGSQGGSVKDLNSRRDLSKNLPTQRVGKDVPSPGFAWSPAESRTTSSQHEGYCLSSNPHPSFPDEHHSSIASANPKSCVPATPIEDRGSSSPSGMLSHSERVPICTTQSAPSTTASNMCKVEETMNQQRTLEVDTSNVSVNQSPESKTSPVSCPDNQYIDSEFPSTRFENKEPAVDHSGLRSASTENLTTDSPVPGTCKMEEIVNQHKVLEADVSDSSANHSPESKACHVSSPNNKNIDCEYLTSTPRSEGKEPAVDNVLSTSRDPENPTTSFAPASDRYNMEEIVDQDKPLDVDASNASLNQTHSIISPVSSADNRDIVCEYPSPAGRSKNKEPLVDNTGFTSKNKEPLLDNAGLTLENKETLVDNPGLTLENTEPLVDNSGSTSENKELLVDDSELTSENKEPRVTPEKKEPLVDNSGSMAENKEPLVDNSGSTAENKEPLVDNSGSMPENKELLVDNSGLTSENKESLVESSGLTSENKEPLVDNSGLTSAACEDLTTTSASASDTCKMDEVLNKKRTHDTDASNGSFTQSPQSKVLLVSSPDNLDIERAFPCPTPIYENKEPVVENPGLTSVVPENLSNPASASDACKMDAILNKKGTLETDANGASIQSPQTKVLFSSSPGNLVIEPEFPSPTPGADSKEPVVDVSGLTLALSENLTAKIPDDSQGSFVLPKPDRPTVELGSTESDFRCEEEIIQKQLYSEPTVVMTESMVIDPSCGAESIDVSDVLESLLEQSCGPSYMHETTALDDLLAASAEDEQQCCSPIALSPWGEPSYYQGAGVDSELWGVQDDPINDMWSLLSPRPALQASSGIGTEGKDTHDINEVDVHENNVIFQVGPTPVQENVNQANSGASTDWVLTEQVISKPNDLSISSVHESTGVVCWQPTANGNLNMGTDWNNNQNSYLSSCEAAVPPSSKSSQEASRKQECTNFGAANSGGATGNTKKSSPSSGNAKWGSQRGHQRDRYSQISESWLLSSDYSRSGSRSTSKGQSRGVCKFNEK